MATLSTLAYQVQTTGRADAKQVGQAAVSIRRDWAFKAGLARAMHAMTTAGDPLRESLYSGRPVDWRFDDVDLTLRLEAESSKPDINYADAALIQRILSIISPEASWTSPASDRHPAGIALLPLPEALVPLEQRFGPHSDLLRRSFTAYTGQPAPVRKSDLDPTGRSGLLGEIDRAMASAGPGGVDRSLYRIVVSLSSSSKRGAASSVGRASREAYVAVSPNDQTRLALIRTD